MEYVRIIEIPDGKMVSSGVGMFGDANFDRFNAWMSAQPPTVFPSDYLFWNGEWGKSGGFHWLYRYEAGMEVPEGFQVVDFHGGLYALITGVDGEGNDDGRAAADAFIRSHGFEYDPGRPELGNVITPPAAYAVLGYHQMDYYLPIRPCPQEG